MTLSLIERQRHLRKYSEGNLGAQRSFYFTGPDGRMKIRCQNLFCLCRLAKALTTNFGYSTYAGEITQPGFAM